MLIPPKDYRDSIIMFMGCRVRVLWIREAEAPYKEEEEALSPRPLREPEGGRETETERERERGKEKRDRETRNANLTQNQTTQVKDVYTYVSTECT